MYPGRSLCSILIIARAHGVEVNTSSHDCLTDVFHNCKLPDIPEGITLTVNLVRSIYEILRIVGSHTYHVPVGDEHVVFFITLSELLQRRGVQHCTHIIHSIVSCEIGIISLTRKVYGIMFYQSYYYLTELIYNLTR